MTSSSPIADPRGSPRRKTLKGGKIVLPGGLSSVIDCVIRDLSEQGARLEVGDSASVPDSFRLVCRADGTIREAAVCWRKERRLGVEFTGEVKKAPLIKW